MALSSITAVIRTGYPYFLNIGRSNGLCKVKSTYFKYALPQIAFITGKAMRADRPPRPAPFDWRNREYRAWDVFLDPMDERIDDNSKLIIIEGTVAAGKEDFAKKLADELEMLYMPPETFDNLFINRYGFDYRLFNSELPVNSHYFDDKMFYADPYNVNTVAMQHTLFVMRMSVYIDAIIHLFATGQGVIMKRSPWSDSVFMKAMFNAGYVSPGGYDYYKSCLANSLHHLLRPHLVIHLDIPPSEAKRRIEKRAIPHEIDSQVLSLKFLEDVESNYKNEYLPKVSEQSHLLVYNWMEPGLMVDIIDDIERLDFNDSGEKTEKFEDWQFITLDDRRAARDRFTCEKLGLMCNAHVCRFDVPEMLWEPSDDEARTEIKFRFSELYGGIRYAEGYDPAIDKGLLWKRNEFRNTPPLPDWSKK